MTPNKLPPLPELVRIGGLMSNAAYNLAQSADLPQHARDSLDSLRRQWEEALRQSQSLPAGAVADEDVWQREYDKEILSNLEQLLRPRKWLGRWDEIVRQLLAEFDALQAGAREKGEAVSGIELAARWVDARREAFDLEHGFVDPGTGTVEFGGGRSGILKEEYSAELYEIAEGIRGLENKACTVPPDGWQCSRSAGHDGPCAALATQPAQASEAADPIEYQNLADAALWNRCLDQAADFMPQARDAWTRFSNRPWNKQAMLRVLAEFAAALATSSQETASE